jgi:hypothetical protein
VANRKLNSDKAFEAYLVYQIRIREYIQMFQILRDIQEGRYCPESSGPESPATTVLTYVTGIFASLMDKTEDALNIFDVWEALYPSDLQGEIVDVRNAIEPTLKTIRNYRNKVAFHANRNLKEYVEAMKDFRKQRSDVVLVIQRFLELAEKLVKDQGRIPDYESRLDHALKNVCPNASEQKLQRLKAYFIHS